MQNESRTRLPTAQVRVLSGCLLALVFATPIASATDFVAKYDHWPERHRINGRVLLGPKTKSAIPILQELALDDKDDAFVVNLSSIASDSAALDGFTSLTLSEFLESPESVTESAKAIIFSGTSPLAKIADSDLAKLRGLIEGYLDEKLSICCVGAAVELAGDVGATDLGLLNDCKVVIGTEPSKKMAAQMEPAAGKLLLTVEPNAVVVLSGRKMLCYGQGGLTVDVSNSDLRARLVPRSSRSMAINDWLLDLTQWRRLAIDQTIEPFPSAQPDPPNVKHGTLFIVGGGGTPRGLMTKFVEAAGGKDAKLIYVPCSEESEVSDNSSMVKMWERMGVASAQTLHTKDRVKANTDETFYAPLQQATGIWFGGGRQWNLADSYYGTETHRQMIEVLNRGGVIGGSSAGASIQARYLARSTPIQNFDIIAPGYERGGLGFLSGVAIDQHFTQRGRHPDLELLVSQYPQLLGIGIDESTAIEVSGTTAKVSGDGHVYFFNQRDKEKTVKTRVAPGDSYDLVNRERISTPATP